MEQITPLSDEQIAVVMKAAGERFAAAGIPLEQAEQLLTPVLEKHAAAMGMPVESLPQEEQLSPKEAQAFNNYMQIKQAVVARFQQYMPQAPVEELEKLADEAIEAQLQAEVEAAAAQEEAPAPKEASAIADRFRNLLKS